jgi:hypothetical protein
VIGGGPPSFKRRATPPPAQRKTIDFALIGAARRIMESALSVVPGELVVIVYDQAREALGAALCDAVDLVSARSEAYMLESFGARPLAGIPDPIRDALARAQASVLIIGVDDPRELGLRRAFVELVERLKLRHAHLIGVTRRALVAGFNVEPARVVDMTRQVRLKVMGKTKLRYRSSYGTDLEVTFAPDTRWGEQVGIIRPGRWENLPAGHIFALPSSARGVFVANASLDTRFKGDSPSLLSSPPLRFEIEGGVCTNITSGDAELATAVLNHIKGTEHLDRIGQIVLGTNAGLVAPIGEPVFDQCVPGLHIVFGWTNPAVTGASWVSDKILCANATGGDLDVDGQPLLRAGRYLV